MGAFRNFPNFRFLMVSSLGVLFIYSYFAILPYHFSSQHKLPLDDYSGKYVASDEIGVFHGSKVRSSKQSDSGHLAKVLGDDDNTPQKWIDVDLTNQRLYAFENGKKVFDFPISSGKWGKTPTGEFQIWIKLKSTKMSGGNKALGTYYYLPNVPYVMYFANDEIPKSRGFGLHGTYWHDNFGTPMSHGCVNMKTEEAELLYSWVTPEVPEGKTSVWANNENPGTKITIYGKAP